MTANITSLQNFEKDENTFSPQKRTGSSSFVLENSLTRRDYQNKGKEMWQLSMNRKEVEEKLKKLENRIKLLNTEQQKTEKIIEGTKKKHENYSKIRDEIAQERIYLNELKSSQKKQMADLKGKLRKDSQDLKKKIHEKKMKLQEKNSELKKNIDLSIKSKLIEKQQEEHKTHIRLKKNAIMVSESIKRIHHKRNSSYQTLRQIREEEYNLKMMQQIKAQDETMRKIQELERLETEIMEKLETTQRMQETVNSILSSPVHKNINLLSFNL